MKVLTKKGSKERLKEMFQRVNKVTLNEDFGTNSSDSQELEMDNNSNQSFPEIEMDEDSVRTIDSINSPIDSLSPNKKKIIMTAIDNLTYKRGRREYSPTAAEINDEILKIQGKSKISEVETNSVNFDEYDTVAVHLWDGVRGAKVGVFYKRPNGSGGYEWKPSEIYPTIIMSYSDLEKPEIAFIKDDTAKKFLSDVGYEYDPYFKTIVPIKASTTELKEEEFDMSGENTTTPEIDTLSGGVGDEIGEKMVNAEQVRKGLKVELEHTDDPMVALDIVYDHLTEDENYYGTDGQDPEQAAQCGAEKDANDIPHASGAYTQDGMAGELDRNGNSIPAIDPDFMMMYNDFKPANIGDDPNINNDIDDNDDDINNAIDEYIRENSFN